MRPRECSDDDILSASEIVMRISLFTTSHVRNVDRTAFQLNRILEVDILSDDERVDFENRVRAIHSQANENLVAYQPTETSSPSKNTLSKHLKKSA